MMEEKVINIVPKWLNPYIKLDIISVDKYLPRNLRQRDHDNDVEHENRSNQAMEDSTNKSLRVVLQRIKIYECKTCYSCYTSQRDYRLHQVKHAKPVVDSKGPYVKKFKCEHCELRFVAASTLQLHSAVHRPFKHVCHCGVGFHKACDLTAHKKLVHSEIKETTWQPKTTYNGKKPKSEFCIKSEYVSPESNVIKTKLGVYKPKLKTNIKRPKLFRYNIKFPEVKSEQIEVDGKIRYVCPTCNNNYASYHGLQVHYLIHTQERPYQCDICPKTFTQPSTLNAHKMRHAGVKFYCPICKKGLCQKAAVSLHMRTHTGEKPYECESCWKRFSDPSAYARHVRTHTGDKRYECPECPMRFSDKSGLIQHEQRHKGEKKHKCEICGKRFYTKWDVSKHSMAMHVKKYAFECDDCGKRFASKATLYTHIRMAGVHSGLKCELCPRVFNKVEQRDRHMRAHRRLEFADCECDLCGETFYSKAAIAKHLRQDH